MSGGPLPPNGCKLRVPRGLGLCLRRYEARMSVGAACARPHGVTHGDGCVSRQGTRPARLPSCRAGRRAASTRGSVFLLGRSGPRCVAGPFAAAMLCVSSWREEARGCGSRSRPPGRACGARRAGLTMLPTARKPARNCRPLRCASKSQTCSQNPEIRLPHITVGRTTARCS